MSLSSYYRHPYLGISGVHYADDPDGIVVRFGDKPLPFAFLRDSEFTDSQRRSTKCCLLRLDGAAIPEGETPDLDVDNGLNVRPVRPKPAEPTDEILKSFPELGPEITPPDPLVDGTQPGAMH